MNATLVSVATVAGVGVTLAHAPARIGTLSAPLPPRARPGAASRVATPSVTAPFVTAGSVADVAREFLGGTRARRCWQGSGRAWIEVRGLDGPSGRAVGARVVAAVRSAPGVQWAELNRAVSRIVVSIAIDGPSLRALCEMVADAECGAHESGADDRKHERRTRSVDLPGDDVVLAEKAIAAAASAVGLGVALVGRAGRLPRLPGFAAAPVIVVDYQPRLRAIVESRLGPATADAALAVATAAAYALTHAAASLMVDLVMRTSLVAETWAGRQAWQRHEPTLAQHAACVDDHPLPARARARSAGPVERHADRAGMAQLAGAAALGAATRNPGVVGIEAMVAAPKPTRTARESFASTLGRGLASRHDVLALHPDALRYLDRVDALVIDPRALLTTDLTVNRIRGVHDRDRTRVWESAQAAVDRGALAPGWHRLSAFPDVQGAAVNGHAEVLVSPIRDPLASAVVAEARRARVEVVSVDVDALGGLRSAFDDLQRPSASTDLALRAAVDRLQRRGATVAVLATNAPQALALADVAIGVLREVVPPPWHAHLVVDDLGGAWRILHALPAARAASRYGVEISTGASLLGALLMLPGVRGVGPEPVTAGAAAGLWAGYSLARKVIRAPLPPSEPGHEWHAMSVAQVRRVLPAPDDAGDIRAPSPVSALLPARLVTRLATAPLGFARDFVRTARTELSDPLTPILATGSAASAVLGSPLDAVLVGSVLLGNAALSATQRLHAERLLKRMLAVQDPPARRIIGGPGHMHHTSVAAAHLRPGDVMEVRSGEVVPADGRLIEAAGVEVDESALTGESLPVSKQTTATPGAPLAERSCMLYAGSTMVAGTAVAVVTAVGPMTAARRAAAVAPPTVHDVGLQAQLSHLTSRALPVSLGGGALVTALGLLRGAGLREAVTSGVAVAVAAVPEGLPLVATLAQQAAARRLTRSAALVRTPRSVEALGRVDLVCFDKTGTLSENRLRVSAVQPAPGFSPEQVLTHAVRTSISPNGDRPDHATDIAIVDAAGDLSVNDISVNDTEAERVAYLPFRSGRPYAAALSGTRLVVKGAPEVVLAACTESDPTLSEQVHRMATSGLRVIAVAQRDVTTAQADAALADPAALEEPCLRGLTPVGLLGLSDTPRAEAAGLLPTLARQQIAVRLITGDHPVTATAIAGELGMPVTPEQVISGTEWDALSSREREEAVETRLVFARMSPENKVQIVQTLERIGHVCAMVGDGANDAAAIRAASLGIGVSSTGSDPARTAADVMLLDGHISSLLDALDEGRQLWQRVQAAVSVLLGGNAGEVTFALIGSAIAGRSPLNARQLLLVNMLTDALPAAALAVSPPNNHARGAGRGPDQAALWRTVTIRGATTAAGATTAWALASVTGRRRRASTVALIALVGTQLGQTLIDSRSPLVVFTAIGSLAAMAALISTPGVSRVVGCTPVGPVGWAQALGSAGAATAVAAIAPGLLTWLTNRAPAAESAQSTITTTPARHNTAYNSRNGGVSNRATTPVNGSALTLTLTSGLDTFATLPQSGNRLANPKR